MARLELRANEIHVWTWSLDAWHSDLDLGSLLVPEERERAEAFRLDHHRRRWIVSRGGLRIILAGYLQSEPRKLRFSSTQYGKPVLASPQHQAISFSLSHSDALAAVAIVDGADIGIDIEQQRDVPEWNDIAQRFFSLPEYDLLCRVPEETRRLAFFRYWTRNEAFLKANGVGLSMSLQDFDVTVSQEDATQILSVRQDTRAAEQWRIYDFEPAPGYSGAIVVKSSVPRAVVQRSLSDVEMVFTRST
jgi:4'-phosphopantetheinyl transferase